MSGLSEYHNPTFPTALPNAKHITAA